MWEPLNGRNPTVREGVDDLIATVDFYNDLRSEMKPTIEIKNEAALEEEKLRAREQWGQDPCGAVHGEQHEFGTREFFDSVERHRYTEYAPWMPSVMGFKQFPGKRLLEVGCGMGSDLLQFARAVRSALA